MSTMTKQALAKFVPGLLVLPDHLKGKAVKQEEVEAWTVERDLRVIEAAKWLQSDGVITFDQLDAGQYAKLSKRQKAEAVKISDVCGGIYSLTCTVHKGAGSEAALAGLVGDSPEQMEYKVLKSKFDKEHAQWKKLKDAKDQFNALLKIYTADTAYKVMGDCGVSFAMLMKRLPAEPKAPKVPVTPKAKKNHVVRTIRITLERVSTKSVTKVSTKYGKRKKITKQVETRTVAHTIVAPLDDDIEAREIPAVVAAVVARLPKGGTIPQWDQYTYEVINAK